MVMKRKTYKICNSELVFMGLRKDFLLQKFSRYICRLSTKMNEIKLRDVINNFN